MTRNPLPLDAVRWLLVAVADHDEPGACDAAMSPQSYLDSAVGGNQEGEDEAMLEGLEERYQATRKSRGRSKARGKAKALRGLLQNL